MLDINYCSPLMNLTPGSRGNGDDRDGKKACDTMQPWRPGFILAGSLLAPRVLRGKAWGHRNSISKLSHEGL